jgi:hypothetical protein
MAEMELHLPVEAAGWEVPAASVVTVALLS